MLVRDTIYEIESANEITLGNFNILSSLVRLNAEQYTLRGLEKAPCFIVKDGVYDSVVALKTKTVNSLEYMRSLGLSYQYSDGLLTTKIVQVDIGYKSTEESAIGGFVCIGMKDQSTGMYISSILGRYDLVSYTFYGSIVLSSKRNIDE